VEECENIKNAKNLILSINWAIFVKSHPCNQFSTVQPITTSRSVGLDFWHHLLAETTSGLFLELLVALGPMLKNLR
jgi:hypothetical protein